MEDFWVFRHKSLNSYDIIATDGVELVVDSCQKFHNEAGIDGEWTALTPVEWSEDDEKKNSRKKWWYKNISHP